jgi:phosphoribosylanthranilate isomerase
VGAAGEHLPAEHHTIVKVCGITRLDDAQTALDAGADWLGFVVKDVGPRRIDPSKAAEIAAVAGAAVTVAVMVDPTPDEAISLAARLGADRVQLHRTNPTLWPADFPLPVIFAIPVAADGALQEILPAVQHLVLLDAAHPTLAGGTGRHVPWESARVVAATRNVMLAGGLDGETVGAALARVRPYGVDASSRLESSPGIKQPDKVRRFVAAVRTFDERARELAG